MNNNHSQNQRKANRHSTSDAGPVAHPLFGTASLIVAAAITFLAFAENTSHLPFSMPRSWYTNRSLWYLFAFAGYIAGYFLLRAASTSTDSLADQRSGPIFNSVRLYTRADCHLCAEAKQLLLSYQQSLPAIEEVDIADDEQLTEQYGKCIPVVEIDGTVRFRGRINEVLLKRLIEGARRQQQRSADET